MKHGIDCIKQKHVGTGYLHDEGDDTPYGVDGWDYCGRCHHVLDPIERKTMKPDEAEGKQRQIDQLNINFKFLMDAIDNIHFALAPDKSGTWQMRTQMAVAATHKLVKEIEALRAQLAAEIAYQNEVSISLAKQVRELTAKLANAEEQLKHERDVNTALSKQSQEYWQDREDAAGYNRELTAKLAAAERDLSQANEAVKALSEGKPLGPVIGSQTILNQALEIKALKEKLALSEAAGASMRLALTEIAEYWNGSVSQGSMEDACLQAVTLANKALATDHGKAYLDVARFARCKDSCSSILNDTPSPCDCGFKGVLDRLPGKGGEGKMIDIDLEKVRKIYEIGSSAEAHLICKLLSAIEAAQREAAGLLNAFRHVHRNRQDGTDFCLYCGLDLRNKIHLAREADKQEKQRGMGA